MAIYMKYQILTHYLLKDTGLSVAMYDDRACVA